VGNQLSSWRGLRGPWRGRARSRGIELVLMVAPFQDLSLEEGADKAQMDEAAMQQAIKALTAVPGSEKVGPTH
jgi:hypothetical protein